MIETMPQTLSKTYQQILFKRKIIILSLIVATVISLFTDITIGSSSLGWPEILRALIDIDSLETFERVILLNVRLPYSLTAVIVGASLGWCGGEMQTVLRNPLASPFTLGVTAAAIAGAAFAMVFNIDQLTIPSIYTVPLCSFIAAFISIVVIQFLSDRFGGAVDSVVLFGIAMVFALNALVSLLTFITDADTLQEITFWTMGSLAKVKWDSIVVLITVVLIALPFAIRQIDRLTLLRAGESHARSMGVDVIKLRRGSLIRVSLVAAVSVAFVGTIGFIGLVGPHFARILVGEDHRYYLPASAFSGALLLSLASIASKMIAPGIIVPIGIVTALIGVPLFMILIFSQRRSK